MSSVSYTHLDVYKRQVLVLGCGPIGLMALQMAKAGGARKIYAAEFSTATARCEMAKKFGADEIIYTDKVKLEDYKFEKGGVDRVLVTAPPKTCLLYTS